MFDHKKWSRPKSVSYPTIWKEFNRKDKDGNALNFIIQDVTEDLYDPCIEHMKKHFFPDEPLTLSLGLIDDQLSYEEQIERLRKILREKISLVCLLKSTNKGNNTSSQIVGVKFSYYYHKSFDDSKEEFKGEIINQLFNVMHHLEVQVNRYKLLNIEDYLDDNGLSVHPNYRCMGIATELLKAKCKLAKAIGVNTVLTIFSSFGSQKAAENAGFKNLVELKYSELAKIFPSYKLNVQGPPSLRFMYMKVNESY